MMKMKLGIVEVSIGTWVYTSCGGWGELKMDHGDDENYPFNVAGNEYTYDGKDFETDSLRSVFTKKEMKEWFGIERPKKMVQKTLKGNYVEFANEQTAPCFLPGDNSGFLHYAGKVPDIKKVTKATLTYEVEE